MGKKQHDEKIYNLGGEGANTYIMYADSVEDIHDGYHSFKELYDNRHILLCHVLLANKDIAFKSRLDHKKEMWEGWFIAGMDTEFGQVSYHMPDEYWNMLPIKELWYNNLYDTNSDSFDVLNMLTDFLLSKGELQNHVANFSEFHSPPVNPVDSEIRS